MEEREALIEAALQMQCDVSRALDRLAMPEWLLLELPLAQLRAIMFLDGKPMITIGELAKSIGLAKPAASQLVDRLVQCGMVERAEDAHDRRRTYINVSAEGHRRIEQMRLEKHERLRQWFSRMSTEDLIALHQGMGALASAALREPVAV